MMDIAMYDYVAGSDFGEVYRLFTDSQVGPLIINKPDHNSMGAFNKWLEYHLEHDFHDFKVFRAGDTSFVGFAYCYDFSATNGHCVFTVAIKPEYQASGAGGFVSLFFLQHLFKFYNLRKVYSHVYGRNETSQKCIEGFGFSLEGHLSDYCYYDGDYDDLLIYGLTRSAFYDKIHTLEL